MSKRIRWRKKPKKEDFRRNIDNIIDLHNVIDAKIKVDKERVIIKEDHPIDTIQEQMEMPNTTIHCPQSVKAEDLKQVKKHPENYIEINMVKKIRIVDNFYIEASNKTFDYKDFKYNIDEESLYLLPTKGGIFIPSCFYYEGTANPTNFKQKNQGITSKALSLLYDEDLYRDLYSGEEGKYNFFIVILSIATLVIFGIGNYYLWNGGFI